MPQPGLHGHVGAVVDRVEVVGHGRVRRDLLVAAEDAERQVDRLGRGRRRLAGGSGVGVELPSSPVQAARPETRVATRTSPPRARVTAVRTAVLLRPPAVGGHTVVPCTDGSGRPVTPPHGRRRAVSQHAAGAGDSYDRRVPTSPSTTPYAPVRRLHGLWLVPLVVGLTALTSCGDEAHPTAPAQAIGGVAGPQDRAVRPPAGRRQDADRGRGLVRHRDRRRRRRGPRAVPRDLAGRHRRPGRRPPHLERRRLLAARGPGGGQVRRQQVRLARRPGARGVAVRLRRAGSPARSALCARSPSAPVPARPTGSPRATAPPTSASSARASTSASSPSSPPPPSSPRTPPSPRPP